MVKLPATLLPLTVSSELIRFIRYAFKKGTRITAVLLSARAKNSPLVQDGLEISFSIKVEWENEINLEHLKTKVSSLAYSLEDNHVDDPKLTLGQILKYNDCKILIDGHEVVECVETEKKCRTSCMNKVKICNFVNFRKGKKRNN